MDEKLWCNTAAANWFFCCFCTSKFKLCSCFSDQNEKTMFPRHRNWTVQSPAPAVPFVQNPQKNDQIIWARHPRSTCQNSDRTLFTSFFFSKWHGSMVFNPTIKAKLIYFCQIIFGGFQVEVMSYNRVNIFDWNTLTWKPWLNCHTSFFLNVSKILLHYIQFRLFVGEW